MKKFYSAFLIAFSLCSFSLQAEEGMWTFDNLPLKELIQKYNFEPSKEWVEHLRLSSVRFQDGGSGSFVSGDGLVMTNHHVGVFQIQKLSTPGNDLVQNGFYADSYEKELKTKDLELNVLVEMHNVTDRVKKSVEKITDNNEALKTRRNEIAKIEDEFAKNSGLKASVTSFYGGGEYWVYLYKVYTDVRLVFAPERNAAYFGGDYDNFTYPRYDLDVSFFRVYENDAPVKSANFLKWKSAGANADELVFISGHPGSTDRLFTVSQLNYMKDVQYPMALEGMERRVKVLDEYAKQGDEQARQALIQRFAIENGLKATKGTLEGLKNSELSSIHMLKEQDFRKKIMEKPELFEKYGEIWDRIDNLVNSSRENINQRSYRNISSDLFNKALTLVRYQVEKAKPVNDRLPGYHDSQLEAIKMRILSKAPVFKELDELSLKSSLENSVNKLTRNDDFIKTVIAEKPVDLFVSDLFKNTKLEDPAYREKLLNMKNKDFLKVNDPMIQLALKVDPLLRAESDKYDKEIQSAIQVEMQKLAEARFAVYGKDIYPDANFTLRLTYGTIKGYPMNGTIAPPFNTLYGLYDRSLSFGNKGDFELPSRFWEKKNSVDLSTKCNFVSTCDIIGGNSGSPIVNKNGEVVGIVFDGNIESLPGRFVYDEKSNRSVGLFTSYIIEAMRKLYGAGKLADEIEGK